MSGDTRIVQTDDSKRAHVVKLGMFFDGEGKALCGATPFPERWYIPGNPADRKDACPGCLTAMRRR
jgi:hypothetical protein